MLFLWDKRVGQFVNWLVDGYVEQRWPTKTHHIGHVMHTVLSAYENKDP